jgi:DinB superfamily
MILDFDRCAQEIQEARRRAEALVLDLSPKLLTTQPEAGKWSIAECIFHLNATAAVVQPLMEKAIAQGRRDNKRGTGPFGIGFKGRFLVWIAEPPPKFRMPAPRNVRPPERIDDPLKPLPDFLRAQDEWERLIRESAGLDLAKIKVGPLFSPLRQRLASAFPWMMAHQRRHLLQAENVKRQIFSAGS